MTIEDQLPGSRVCVIIRDDLLEWVAKGVKNSQFGSRSHAINYALAQLKDNGKKANSETT